MYTLWFMEIMINDAPFFSFKTIAAKIWHTPQTKDQTKKTNKKNGKTKRAQKPYKTAATDKHQVFLPFPTPSPHSPSISSLHIHLHPPPPPPPPPLSFSMTAACWRGSDDGGDDGGDDGDGSGVNNNNNHINRKTRGAAAVQLVLLLLLCTSAVQVTGFSSVPLVVSCNTYNVEVTVGSQSSFLVRMEEVRCGGLPLCGSVGVHSVL